MPSTNPVSSILDRDSARKVWLGRCCLRLSNICSTTWRPPRFLPTLLGTSIDRVNISGHDRVLRVCQRMASHYAANVYQDRGSRPCIKPWRRCRLVARDRRRHPIGHLTGRAAEPRIGHLRLLLPPNTSGGCAVLVVFNNAGRGGFVGAGRTGRIAPKGETPELAVEGVERQ